MTLQTLTLTVRSPLHIGSGGVPLRAGIDFVSFGRFLYVLNQDAVLDYFVPQDASFDEINRIINTQNLASGLKQVDLQQHPDLTRYRLGGSAKVSEVLPQLKDVYGQPYIPGSGLKGAIRTVLAAALAEQQKLDVGRAPLGPRREWAARELEQSLFGRAPRPSQAPNYDLMRTVQVTDSGAVSPESLQLDNVAVWPAGQKGIPIDIETIKPGTEFSSRLKIDDYLFGPRAADLDFTSGESIVRNWAAACQEHGIEQIRQEHLFFLERAPQVTRFYADLQAEAERREPGTFFVQLGWGTGWNSKTLSRIIKPDRALMARLVDRYRLTKGFYQQGMPFPKTRHVVADRGTPLLPLGWVEVRVG